MAEEWPKDFPFELATSAIEGLKVLNNEINEEITKKVIVNAVKQLLVNGPALPARSEIYESSAGVHAKQADFGICCILLLSARHSTDVVTLRQILVHIKLNSQTIDQLAEAYEKFKDELINKISKQGNSHNLPEWTNVSVEVERELPTGEVSYKIKLLSFDHESGQNKIIDELHCNQEELQSFINSLRDIERHCERLTKQN
ncbi:CLUMA_CG015330, isoform A [Clunio marinus]|uniref:CLUMA_CG015330, isoform A n=1 Tax=Clunio marinus TaxID=568069 RepID=A0A1J1IV95_9DIPT|nr:CLUMA_CG015330, isoform A [Clunio marinus]